MKLEIGNVIKVTNAFNVETYEIFRVTKNKAVGKSKDGYEKSFYREEINGLIRLYPHELYPMNDCELIK